MFCTGLEYVPTRDGSGTNPAGDVLTKKSYCGCVKPENGVENPEPDIFTIRAARVLFLWAYGDKHTTARRREFTHICNTHTLRQPAADSVKVFLLDYQRTLY